MRTMETTFSVLSVLSESLQNFQNGGEKDPCVFPQRVTLSRGFGNAGLRQDSNSDSFDFSTNYRWCRYSGCSLTCARQHCIFSEQLLSSLGMQL